MNEPTIIDWLYLGLGIVALYSPLLVCKKFKAKPLKLKGNVKKIKTLGYTNNIWGL